MHQSRWANLQSGIQFYASPSNTPSYRWEFLGCTLWESSFDGIFKVVLEWHCPVSLRSRFIFTADATTRLIVTSDTIETRYATSISSHLQLLSSTSITGLIKSETTQCEWWAIPVHVSNRLSKDSGVHADLGWNPLLLHLRCYLPHFDNHLIIIRDPQDTYPSCVHLFSWQSAHDLI